jgi:hypothetical protein
MPQSAVVDTTSTEANHPAGEMVLRRRGLIWPVDTAAVVVVYALVAATISLNEGPQAAGRVNRSLGIAVVVVGLALAWRRPTLTLRPTGLTVRGQTIAWADISGISEVCGLRSRYVRIFVVSQQHRPRAASTSTWLSEDSGPA